MWRFLGLSIALGVLQFAFAQVVSVTTSSVPGVLVTGPPAAEYDAAIHAFFGPTRSANLNDWLPYGIVIANKTRETIVAMAIRWQLSYPGARNPGGSGLSHAAFDQPSRQLAAGKTAVAVPDQLLLDGAPLPPVFQLPPPAGAVQRSSELQRFRSAQRVVVTLDGVVFASGHFVGCNAAKEYEQYVADTTMPAKIAADVVAMKAAGEPVAHIVAWLKTTASQPVNVKAEGWWNRSAASHAARQLLKSYQKGGEVLLFDTAQSCAQKTSIHVYR